MLYAVGQGALAVECRVNDSFILNVLSKLCDFNTQCRILTERSFLKTLGGGCSAPVGIDCEVTESMNSIEQEFTIKAMGAVWSLNGEDEVVNEVSTEFKLLSGNVRKKSGDDLEVTPPKRQRMADDGSKKGDSSPEVIDDSGCSTNTNKNVEEIVNIHGKVFDVCPYSGQSKAPKNDNKTETTSGACPVSMKFDPVKMPIGQDFMGECPVLNTEQKITFEIKSGDSLTCPIADKQSYLTSRDQIDKCPFFNNQKEEVCELIDYEANNKMNPKPQPKSLIENVKDVKLFCGFFCHDNSVKPIFDQCEELGVTLAQKLISAGALEIMKIAQNEIHSKC